jgi:hypothetical protein
MSDAQQAAIYSVVSHAPDWLRRELLSEDRVARAGAEEALAAMIANALRNLAEPPSAR